MIYLLLAEGFEEIEALTPLDLLRRAGLSVETVGVTGKTVKGSHGIPVVCDIELDDLQSPAELVILPGGMPGSKNLDQEPRMTRILKDTLQGGGRLAAICAAPFVLGKRDLLNGKKAVCYPGFENQLIGAIHTSDRVITDGQITTAIGMGAAEEFALELVGLMAGSEMKERLHQGILAR